MFTTVAQLGAASASPTPLGLAEVVAPYMGVFFVAFFVCFLLTPVMRRLAIRNGVVDWPDLKRKQHRAPIAYLGGIAIFLGWFAGVALCFLMPPLGTWFFAPVATVAFPVSIVVGAAVITLTGLFDDVYGISPRVKVAGQFFAAAALALDDLGMQFVSGSLIVLGFDPSPGTVYVLGTIAIALFVVGGCNAVNLLDGLDGLASGVTAIAAAGFLLIAALVAVGAPSHGVEAVNHMITDPKRIVMCLAIMGALLGFLPYNFNPATIFMGDAGSLLLGFLSVSSILLFAETPERFLLLVTAAMVVFALPIADTSLAIFRRKMAGQPILSPDSRHLHHLLRRAGLSVKQSVGVLYGLAVAFALFGIAMVLFDAYWPMILGGFAVVFVALQVVAYSYGVKVGRADAAEANRTHPLPQDLLVLEAAATASPSGRRDEQALANATEGGNMPARPSAGT